MKKIILITFITFFTMTLKAQWTNNGAFLTTSDKVGIGITNPAFGLEVGSSNYTISRFKRLGSGGGAAVQIANAQGTQWSVAVGANNHFGISKSADPFGSQFIILDNGKIGINDITPSFMLDLDAGGGSNTLARFKGSFTGPQGIQVERSGGDKIRLVANYSGYGGGLESTSALRFSVNGNTQSNPALYINANGQTGIGTTSMGSHRLAVDGSVGAREIKVEVGTWSDFVFKSDYELRSLKEVEDHINEKGHLPEIPSEAEVTANGINLGEMNAKLLQKIEELTLYLIEQNKKLDAQQAEIEQLKEQVKQ